MLRTDSTYGRKKYDREMDDIFAIQDEIAENIAEHLKVALLKEEELS